MLGRVVDLAHNPQNVGLVVLLRGGIQRSCGFERAHGELGRRAFESAPKHRQDSTAMFQWLVKLLGEASEKSLFGAFLFCKSHRRFDDLFPLLRLSTTEPSKHIIRHQGETLIVATVVAVVNPTARLEVIADLLLESLLMLRRHHSHLQLTGHCRRNQCLLSFFQKTGKRLHFQEQLVCFSTFDAVLMSYLLLRFKRGNWRSKG